MNQSTNSSNSSTSQSPFQILSEKGSIEVTRDQLPSGSLEEQITFLLKSSPVFLFMKGNSDFPQCGFSASVVGILSQLQTSFKTFDILSYPELRQFIKEYSQWPTFPQLYIQGELIGGNDIVTQLFQQGELQKLLQNIS
jgi:monothiol glutaredoxin